MCEKCIKCTHYGICSFYKALGTTTISNECGYFEDRNNLIPIPVHKITEDFLKEAWVRIEELDKLCGDLQKANSELPKEIFQEIEKTIIDSSLLPKCCRFIDIDELEELKKKYTESEGKG